MVLPNHQQFFGAISASQTNSAPPSSITISLTSGTGYLGSVYTSTASTGQWYADETATGVSSSNLTMLAEYEGKALTYRVDDVISNSIKYWSPLAITTNMLGWWDASAQTTLTIVDNNVSRWDSRNNSLYFEQATSTLRPTYSATGRNSLPAIAGNGTSLFLQLNDASSLPVGTTVSQAVGLAYCENITGWRGLLMWGAQSGGRYHLAKSSTGNVTVTLGTAATDNISTVSWLATDKIVSSVIAGTRSTLNIDGNTTAVTKTATYNTTGTSPAYLFRNVTTTQYWSGSLQEFAIFNAELSDTNRQKFEGYLAAKWNQRALLPAGHPYKSTSPT